ncbi:MAG: two-component system sensor histidine kinase NtrB [Candidatus Bathyarchaeia archaeon]|jgi:signal transduction histidine kinase
MSCFSQELFAKFIERIDHGFELLDLVFDECGNVEDFIFLNINPAFERQIGVKAADLIGKRKKLYAPTSEQRWYDYAIKAVKTGQSLSYEYYDDKVKKTFETQFIPIATDKIAVMFKDITDRKDLERQVQEKERLAAIGETAGMVGHDIRNPLQAITGDIYLLKNFLTSMPEEIPLKKEVTESLEEIEKNITYINKIVADLQDYSRKLKPETVEVEDICGIINGFLNNIDIPNNIDLSHSCSVGELKIKIELTFLNRILTNLTTNAIQAMPNGGKLTIATFTKEDNLTITVEDTGVGIPEEIKSKLFTPMMTTKAKGQGLGLSVVKRLVEIQGGSIDFESQINKGTKFTVKIPLNLQQLNTVNPTF